MPYIYFIYIIYTYNAFKIAVQLSSVEPAHTHSNYLFSASSFQMNLNFSVVAQLALCVKVYVWPLTVLGYQLKCLGWVDI